MSSGSVGRRGASPVRRVIVFRQGSIGDFVISLPCFHLIRKSFPYSEIVLLTNEPSSASTVPAESVLEGTRLVDRYIRYPGGTRDPIEMRELRRQIEAKPDDVLIYLAGVKGAVTAYRDYLFFRMCGIRDIRGLPRNPRHLDCLKPSPGCDLWEPEARRLARQLEPLGAIDLTSPEYWDLHLSAEEIVEAGKVLEAELDGESARLLGLSLGTKQPINDWGDANWRAVLDGLRDLGLTLVLLGGDDDRARSGGVAERWPGRVVNLCGRLSPRISAAVLRSIPIFLCHDSGPMHLAATVGARCVAVFSRRNPPGMWFPFGTQHEIFYPTAHDANIEAIRPPQVIAGAVRALGEVRAAA